MSWVSGNRYLTLEEMQNNAVLIWDYFSAKEWTIESVSAMLGNMQSESSINPGIWENLTVDYSRGYGLTQWTPATKYIDWAGIGYENGNRQCERIQYEMENGLQWFSNPYAPIVDPPLTFSEFSQSTESVETLANYFLWFYEHPTDTIQPIRAEQALYWYEFLGGLPKQKKKKMPIYMMCRRIL